MKEKVLFSWSSGKDSALALYRLKQSDKYEVNDAVTTITSDFSRSSMHGIRQDLLKQQIASLQISYKQAYISKDCSNQDYESQMLNILMQYKALGISIVAFGDICLKDLRKYREEKLSQIGMQAIFPLWGENTIDLAHEFIDLGFKAVVSCVDLKSLDRECAGKIFNNEFLLALPSGIDPCGENGEFHTFVFDGPLFSQEVLFKKGKKVLRDNYFCYCDLIPL